MSLFGYFVVARPQCPLSELACVQRICRDSVDGISPGTLGATRCDGNWQYLQILNGADLDAVDELVAKVEQELGGVDILINNAGKSIRRPLAESLDRWHDVERTMTLNYYSPLRRIRGLAPGMIDRGEGHIINVSTWGVLSESSPLFAVYNASKAAVHHLTKSLAAEWGARGVRVNAVAPTYIATPLNAFVKNSPQMYDAWIGGTPMARMGEVDEIASVVLFLASDAASLMTGSVVLVDGGYTCW